MSSSALVKPYLVIDSDFPESVGNYGSIIDSINKNHKFSSKLSELATNVDVEFYNTVIGSVELLKSLPDKQLEATLNLVFYFLSEPLFKEDEQEGNQEPTDKLEAQFTERLEALLVKLYELSPSKNPQFNDKIATKFTTVVSILSIFFNLINNASKLRYEILNTILKVFSKLDEESLEENAYLLKPILKKSTNDNTKYIFEKYLTDANISSSDILSFTNTLSNLVEVVYPSEALVILKSVVLKYQDTESPEVVKSLLSKAFRNSKEVDLSYFYKLNLSSLQSSKDILFQLLSFYTLPKNNLPEFSKFISDNQSAVEAATKSKISTLLIKKEFLIVANLALKASESGSYEATVESENNKRNKSFHNIAPVITYKQISDALGQNPDLIKIESVLINAVKLKIFEGKIDQLKQIFSIYKINLIIVHDEESENRENKLGSKEWKFILNNLKHWKASLNEAREVVEQQKKRISSN